MSFQLQHRQKPSGGFFHYRFQGSVVTFHWRAKKHVTGSKSWKAILKWEGKGREGRGICSSLRLESIKNKVDRYFKKWILKKKLDISKDQRKGMIYNESLFFQSLVYMFQYKFSYKNKINSNFHKTKLCFKFKNARQNIPLRCTFLI